MSIKQDILAPLIYFDVFHHQLTQNEIAQFLKKTYCPEEFTDGLRELTMENWIHKFDEFYSVQDDYSLIQRRRNGNIKAKAMLNIAERVAGLLLSFPFVKEWPFLDRFPRILLMKIRTLTFLLSLKRTNYGLHEHSCIASKK